MVRVNDVLVCCCLLAIVAALPPVIRIGKKFFVNLVAYIAVYNDKNLYYDAAVNYKHIPEIFILKNYYMPSLHILPL